MTKVLRSTSNTADFFGFFQAIFQETDPRDLRAVFLRSLLDLQKVERGSIWVRDKAGYVCVEAAGAGSERVLGLSLGLDRPSIVGWVMDHGKMTLAQAGQDERHYKELEEGLDLKSRAILCFPLILRDGTVYGAVELIDTSLAGDRLNLDSDYLAELQRIIGMGALALSNSLDLETRTRENKRLKGFIRSLRREETIIGRAPALQEILRIAGDYAGTDYAVLIRGDSGTGKELLARRIHRDSGRTEKPFLVQNVSSIPGELLESELFGFRKGAFSGAEADREGLFAAAHQGTLFLDEIGDMPLALQAKILRVLQEGEVKPLGGNETLTVDVRIISATNRDLEEMIEKGEFREDLFYRLNVLPLKLPTLAQRQEDIPLLAEYFIGRETVRLGLGRKRFSTRTMEHLISYHWPGNVRELENLARYLLAVVKDDSIKVRDLPAHLKEAPERTSPAPKPAPPQVSPGPTVQTAPAAEPRTWPEMERAYALSLLRQNRWNITRAAKQAGLNRSTFVSRMRRLGISKRGK